MDLDKDEFLAGLLARQQAREEARQRAWWSQQRRQSALHTLGMLLVMGLAGWGLWHVTLWLQAQFGFGDLVFCILLPVLALLGLPLLMLAGGALFYLALALLLLLGGAGALMDSLTGSRPRRDR